MGCDYKPFPDYSLHPFAVSIVGLSSQAPAMLLFFFFLNKAQSALEEHAFQHRIIGSESNAFIYHHVELICKEYGFDAGGLALRQGVIVGDSGCLMLRCNLLRS